MYICIYLYRWLTALTKIKFVEKYIPRMNAGLEKATPSAVPVQPRTRAGLTGRHRGEAMRAHAQPHLRADLPAYISLCHTHSGSLTNCEPSRPSGGGGGGLEANQGASVHAAGTVYDPGGVRTSYGRLDKV